MSIFDKLGMKNLSGSFKIVTLIYLTFFIISIVTTPTTAYFSDQVVYEDTLPPADVPKDTEDESKDEKTIKSEASNDVDQENNTSNSEEHDKKNQDQIEKELTETSDQEPVDHDEKKEQDSPADEQGNSNVEENDKD